MIIAIAIIVGSIIIAVQIGNLINAFYEFCDAVRRGGRR